MYNKIYNMYNKRPGTDIAAPAFRTRPLIFVGIFMHVLTSLSLECLRSGTYSNLCRPDSLTILQKWCIIDQRVTSIPLFATQTGVLPHDLVESRSREIRHYGDVIMGTMASQITSLAIVYSTVWSGTDQRKHQSSVSLAFVWGIHR